jgi:polysaccharide deacetylase family protein (PEP-CTERM system associated)
VSGSRVHSISFDVEEFFQVANLRDFFPMQEWDQVASRLDVGMEHILGALAAADARATFFFLGWVAERRPDWVRRVHEAGHEVASHGHDHRFLGDVGPGGFDEHLALTEQAIESAGVPRPVGFRASTFTLTRDTWWAMEGLARRGYLYDSSVHPVRHPTYGIPDFEPGISRVSTPAGEVIEFPVATYPLLGRNWPVGGGGYFRLLPGAVHRTLIARLERMGRPTALYLHPWEFDPQQPRLPAPLFKRFRHYLNLDRSLPRLERLLARFEFGTMREVLEGREAQDG